MQMRKIRTQSSAKGYRELKTRPRTTREALLGRLPSRTAQHIRHAHILKGIREIPRVGWETWEPVVAETLRTLEKQRYDKANRYYHAVQRIEGLLAAVRRRSAELEATAAELERTGVYLQTLMDTMVDVLVTIDVDGVITDVNRATERLSGYDRTELIGQPFHRFFTDPDHAQAGFEQVVETSEVSNYQLTLLTKEGREVPVSYNATVLVDLYGRVTGAVGNIRDTTERKQTEEVMRRQTEELQRSNAELEQFAYVASHDLREPLRKIQTFSDRLLLTLGAKVGEREHDYLKRMHDAAERMQNLINDLLAFSRITTRAQPFTQVDLNQVMREVLSDLEVSIEQGGGHVEVGDLPTIEAEPTQMRQLLQNLLSNALKFRRSGVPPLVRIHSELLPEFSPGLDEGNLQGRNFYRILVQDNGIGFEERYLGRIFTLFQRLHGREEYEGTGMGLALCRKIVERHAGHITAKSKPGEGSTFIVTLPGRQPAEEAQVS
jgi:two-component system sensor kinase FixL